MTEEKPDLPDKVLRIQPSPESIERLNRSFAVFGAQIREWSFGLKARSAFGALIAGNEVYADAVLDELDADQLRRVQDTAAALSLSTSRRLTGERDEGQAAALDRAWLLTVKAQALDEIVELIAADYGPNPVQTYMTGWWDRRDRDHAIDMIKREAAQMRRDADELRARATLPTDQEGGHSS